MWFTWLKNKSGIGNPHLIFPILLVMSSQAFGQFVEPNSVLILNTLRDISVKHQFALQEERLQTAKLVQQIQQFYDTYTLLRNDIEFSQSLYRDFKAIDNLDMTTSYTLSNFIINSDRLNYWFPNLSGDVNRSTFDIESLLNNSEQLKQTYESFALSVNDETAPEDAELRRQNAMAGEQFYSQALFEYALKCQVLAKTYDSLAVELYKQVANKRNNFTQGERAQLMVESVKMRDLSNSYYEKYLTYSEQTHKNELNMYDEKLNMLRSNANLEILKNQINKTSKIRYGFFDIVSTPFQ
ncbi:hypothetical protein JW960_05400 [candidate division KSB1 bacterium]|nr:hypothetical protein [candidate division KSB1 bacterium]